MMVVRAKYPVCQGKSGCCRDYSTADFLERPYSDCCLHSSFQPEVIMGDMTSTDSAANVAVYHSITLFMSTLTESN